MKTSVVRLMRSKNLLLVLNLVVAAALVLSLSIATSAARSLQTSKNPVTTVQTKAQAPLDDVVVGVSPLSSVEIDNAYQNFRVQYPQVSVTLASFTSAAFSGSLSHGAGYSKSYSYNGRSYTTWAGWYKFVLNGTTYRFYCYFPTQPAKAPYYKAQVPNLQSHSTTGAYVAMTAKANYLLDKYGNSTGSGTTTANEKAAAVKYLVMFYSGSSTTRTVAGIIKSKLHAAALSYITAYKADVEAHFGPYAASMTLASKPLPGNTGRATFKLWATHTNKLMANVPLKATISGPAKLTSTVRTTGTGTRSIPFTATGFGKVTVCGDATALPGTKASIWWSANGYQQYASAGSRTHVRKCVSYTVAPVVPKVTKTCDVDCKGVATVTKSITNPYGYAIQVHTLDNGVLRPEFVSVPAHTTTPVSYSLKVTDRHTVQTQLWVNVGGTWVKTNLNDKFTVDCPEIQGATLTLGCDCTHTATTITVKANTTQSVQKTEVNNVATGASVLTVTSNPGDAQKTVPVSGIVKGVTYVISCSAQKLDGTWRTIVCGHFSEG